MAAAPGAPGPAPLPSGKTAGPGKGGARNSAPSPGLLNPSQQLSGPALSQAAQSIANAQTQGPISELAKQIATLNGQGSAAQSQTFGYYMQLAKEAQDAVNQEQQIGSGLNSQLGQIGQNTTAQLGQLGQQAQGGALGRLSALGLGGDQQAQLQGETARQQGLGALNSGVFQSAGATQGANYSGNAASNLGTFALRGQERLGNIAQATRLSEEPLTAKIAALQEKNGALYGTALGQLRAQERNYQVAQEGLGIKQQTLQNTVANDRTRNNLAAGQQNPLQVGSPAWARVQGADGKAWSDNPQAVGSPAWARIHKSSNANPGGGAKPLSTLENNAWFSKLGRVEQLIQNGQQAKQPEAQIRAFLASGDNPAKTPFDPFMVQVAYELLGYGSINRSTAAVMHSQYGLRSGTFRNAPIKVTRNYKPGPIPTPGQAAGAVANTISGF